MKGHNGNSINAAYCVTSHWSQLKKKILMKNVAGLNISFTNL